MMYYNNDQGNGIVANVYPQYPVQKPVSTQQAVKDCLKKYPGSSARALIIIFASLSFGFSFVAFFDEFRDNVPKSTGGRASKTYYIRGYGHGYQAEVLNQIQLGIFSLCFVFSVAVFIVIGRWNKFAKRWSKMDRILHFVFGAILLSGWVCGIMGTLQFVSKCCHVSDYGMPYTSTYHESPELGYPNRCMCNLKVRWKQHVTGNYENLNTTEHWNGDLYNKTDTILKAVPHDFESRCNVLIFGFIWLLLYTVSIIFST